jgi:hypothetical protein
VEESTIMMKFKHYIQCIDAHTAGEPLRIITTGLPPIHGKTILEKRQYMLENYDHLRKLLMFEPRGHSGMYGCILVDPVTKDGDLGVLFTHNEGLSSMCGHGIIGITKVALETGMLPIKEGENIVRIDTPAGRVTAFMTELSQYIHEMIATLKATPVRLIKDSGKSATKQTEKTYGTCPFCGHPVVGSPKAFGCSNWRNGCKFTIWKKIAGKQIPEEAVEKLIATGKTEKMTGFTSRAGKPFSAALVIKEDRTIGFEF